MIVLDIQIQCDPGDEQRVQDELTAMVNRYRDARTPIFIKDMARNDTENPGGGTDFRHDAFRELVEGRQRGIGSGSGYSPSRIAGR